MYPYKIGGVFTLYGLMIGVGIALCYFVLWSYCKKAKIENRFVDFITYATLISVAFGFVSAMLFQSLYEYIENPAEGFQVNGSMTLIGGLIGGVVVFFIIYLPLRKKYQSKFIDIISIFPCSIMLAIAFGRIGCFCAGCCHGIQTDSIWGITFVGMEHPVYPTQLFESAFFFVLFAIASFLFLKYRFKYNLPLFLLFYGLFRYLIEFIRGDERGAFIAGMSPSQFWSIVMMVIAVPLAVLLYYMHKKRDRYLIEHPIIEPLKKLNNFYQIQKL